MTTLTDILKMIQQGEVLSEPTMHEAMNIIMSGEASDPQIAAFLMGLSLRGETAEEITGAAAVLREKASHIKAPEGTVDCCGTGGDHTGTYNISTAVALVCAACGVPVAKHGNRAASSQSGAADVLEALGVSLDMSKERLETALQQFNFCFLMAQHHHQAMKHVMPVRKSLGFRTLFNLLGPLANPADTKYQLLGVFDKKWMVPMAQALHNLGSHKAWLVHGRDGMDEITLTTDTDIAILENGHITEKTLSPDDFGLPPCAPDDLKGGDSETNAKALHALLEGEQGPYRNIVLANTAAILNIAGKEHTLKSAVSRASDAIESGAALNILEQYISFSKGH